MSTAIYVRVSTERQTQAQTIDQQIERLRRHLAAQGEELQAEDIFRDESYSGATLNRPGLDRLRDQVKAARITHVLIVSPDRLARNYVHQMVLLEEFAQAGCGVEFLERPMSEDPHDQLVLQIRGAVAEYERTLRAERMRRGRQRRIRAGVLLPWTPPRTAIGCTQTVREIPQAYRLIPSRWQSSKKCLPIISKSRARCLEWRSIYSSWVFALRRGIRGGLQRPCAASS
jgi:DNA invertase Pin-like site-specific DNA recombinase